MVKTKKIKLTLFIRRDIEGTTTIEFAIVFPLMFIIAFMGLLFFFWIGDAVIQSYAGFRLNQIYIREVPLAEDSPILEGIRTIPTLNRFQDMNFSHHLVNIDGQNSFSAIEYSFENPLMPAHWLRLALATDWQSRHRFSRLAGFTLSIKEPFLPFNDEHEDS